MNQAKRLRFILTLVVILGFTILLIGGAKINQNKPPIPTMVKSESGEVLISEGQIVQGQKIYLSRGGQHLGSVWGHGAYLAPDWSADALHRMGLAVAAFKVGANVTNWANSYGEELNAVAPVEKSRLSAQVKEEFKVNRYDAATDTLILTAAQTAAYKAIGEYYQKLFSEGNHGMGVPKGMVRDLNEGSAITAFFFWTAWAAVTPRIGVDYSYTANWPFDELVGNTPLPSMLIWSILSVILLIFGIGAAIFFYMRLNSEDTETPKLKPLALINPTQSQRAVLPYFLVVVLLFFIQLLLGSITGHYAVEGNALFGINMESIFPYAVARTWHVQLSVFWIATAWLATGIFIGPFVSGKEPRHQSKLTWILLIALTVVVVGALSGTYASIAGFMGINTSFLFGTQGYEYIELGRVWQVALLAGMLLWLVIVLRAIKPTLDAEKSKWGLTHMLLYAAISIPLFYSMGLFYSNGTHISIADYWRWWVVHLWVENFFEVFATVTLAFVLTRIGAAREKFAENSVYFSIILYLGSGIVGTFHHLYFSGSPLFITALGSVFSALEVVPLAMLGFEVFHNLKLTKLGNDMMPGSYPYRWPIYFFIAVAFWNLLGAGVFGFMINPPIVLYYIQGMNTTPIHSHGALFGVYGFLAIALMLFSMRHIVHEKAWSDRLLKWSFWGLNIGLFTMIFFSLVPAGFYQFQKAVEHGVWYARSPIVTGSDFIHMVTWFRVIPDIIFDLGALALVAFVVRAIVIDCKIRCTKK